MIPTTTPAQFIPEHETGRYLPANKVATGLAARLSKMKLDDKDLLTVKSWGYRTTLPNGEPIDTGVTA